MSVSYSLLLKERIRKTKQVKKTDEEAPHGEDLKHTAALHRWRRDHTNCWLPHSSTPGGVGSGCYWVLLSPSCCHDRRGGRRPPCCCCRVRLRRCRTGCVSRRRVRSTRRVLVGSTLEHEPSSSSHETTSTASSQLARFFFFAKNTARRREKKTRCTCPNQPRFATHRGQSIRNVAGS